MTKHINADLTNFIVVNDFISLCNKCTIHITNSFEHFTPDLDFGLKISSIQK